MATPVPSTQFNNNGTPIDSGAPRNVGIPSAIIEGGLMSSTSQAADCFVLQKFSNKLQAFMIGYVNAINSNYSIFE